MDENLNGTRIATVDLGTNTALLLVADVVEGDLVTVRDEERFVRLGEGVDGQRTLAEPAMDRAIAALHDYAEIANEEGATIVAAGATSATRDARNRGEFIARVEAETGIRIEVLSGDAEAECSFIGAVSADPVEGEIVVLDVGGGSAEVIIGTAADGPLRRWSLDVGAVRLTERFFGSIPPNPQEAALARTFVERELASVPGGPFDSVIGASGTVRALASVASEGRREELGAEEVSSWLAHLLTLDRDEVLALDPKLMSGRTDVFASGVMIIDAVMRQFGAARLIASPRGLRHGLALRWLRSR